jgi:hypothetical protein
MSRKEAAACYRLYASYCFEIAHDPLNPGRRVALLDLAQAWARLAEQIEQSGQTDLVAEGAPPDAKSAGGLSGE